MNFRILYINARRKILSVYLAIFLPQIICNKSAKDLKFSKMTNFEKTDTKTKHLNKDNESVSNPLI